MRLLMLLAMLAGASLAIALFPGCALLGLRHSRELPPEPAITTCENVGPMIYCENGAGKHLPPVECSKAPPLMMIPVEDYDMDRDWIEVLKK